MSPIFFIWLAGVQAEKNSRVV
ncbi:DUF4014 family protein [Salmonella enterica subsp. enterica serovar Rissen]